MIQQSCTQPPQLAGKPFLAGHGEFNIAEAELLGSSDGSACSKMAEFHNNRHGWGDMPVTCETPVRFIRLRVIKGEGPGGRQTARICPVRRIRSRDHPVKAARLPRTLGDWHNRVKAWNVASHPARIDSNCK